VFSITWQPCWQLPPPKPVNFYITHHCITHLLGCSIEITVQLGAPIAQSVQWLCSGSTIEESRFQATLKRCFSSPQWPGRLCGPTQTYIQGAFGVLSPKLKREGCKAERSHPTRLRMTLYLLCHFAFMACTRTILCLFLCNSSASLHSMQQISSWEASNSSASLEI
jgi:hypothetical protein